MKRLLHLVAVLVLIFADQITKLLILNSDIANGNSLPLIKNVFHLSYVENRGMIWGVMSGNGPLVLLLISVPVAAMLLWLYFKTPLTKRYLPLRVVIIMTIAGAVGNIIDRIRLGYVVDFLDFTLIDFPVFNIADCYITIAAFATLFLGFFYYKDEDFECYSFKKKEK